MLKLGRRKLHLWEGKEGDGSIVSSTPYKNKKILPSNMDLLEKRISEYDQKEMPSIKWLDKLTMKRVEKMELQDHQQRREQQQAINDNNPSFTFNNPFNYNHMNNPSFFNQHNQCHSFQVDSNQQCTSLVIDFPPFKHPIVYHQRTCNPLLPEILPNKERDRVFVLHDPELGRDNPVEMKCHKLINARSSKGYVTWSTLFPMFCTHKHFFAVF
jgi:hypothetical protein